MAISFVAGIVSCSLLQAEMKIREEVMVGSAPEKRDPECAGIRPFHGQAHRYRY
jgi:hypothetical protein